MAPKRNLTDQEKYEQYFKDWEQVTEVLNQLFENTENVVKKKGIPPGSCFVRLGEVSGLLHKKIDKKQGYATFPTLKTWPPRILGFALMLADLPSDDDMVKLVDDSLERTRKGRTAVTSSDENVGRALLAVWNVISRMKPRTNKVLTEERFRLATKIKDAPTVIAADEQRARAFVFATLGMARLVFGTTPLFVATNDFVSNAQKVRGALTKGSPLRTELQKVLPRPVATNAPQPPTAATVATTPPISTAARPPLSTVAKTSPITTPISTAASATVAKHSPKATAASAAAGGAASPVAKPASLDLEALWRDNPEKGVVFIRMIVKDN